jgi:hypothetical protein
MKWRTLLLAFGAALLAGGSGIRAQVVPRSRIRAVRATAAVLTLKYVGDLNGLRADAVVSFEALPDYVLAAGRIQSSAASYTFGADLYGDTGYGTIVDLGNGTRWQIKFQVYRDGFALTSNPFGPGRPSTYVFKLVANK